MATIKSTGGDYTTWALWEADTDNDLTGAGILVGEIFDVNATAALTIAGATNTDASNYRHLTVNSAHRHAYVFDTGKANITVSSIPAFLVLGEAFARASFIQGINSRNPGEGVFSCAAASTRVTECIGKHDFPSGGDGCAAFTTTTNGANSKFINCAAFNNRNGFYSPGTSALTGVEWLNCISVNNTVSGFRTDAGVPLAIKNCYAGGNATNDYMEGGAEGWESWTATTCMSAQAITETGLTPSIAFDTSNFTNVTAGSEDLHLVTGSDLIDAGTDLSGTFTIDINGATRSGTWDVGPDEFVAAGGGADIDAAGAATVTAAGASIAAAAFGADGAATLTVGGAALAAAELSAGGAGAVDAEGAAVAATQIAADGAGALDAEGAAIAAAPLAADGAGDFTAEGAAVAEGAGALDAAGASDFVAEGASIAEAALQSDGEAAFTADGEAVGAAPAAEVVISANDLGGPGGRSGWGDVWRRLHDKRYRALRREDEEIVAALRAAGPEIMRHQRPPH